LLTFTPAADTVVIATAEMRRKIDKTDDETFIL
jgi:hypothetical protein